MVGWSMRSEQKNYNTSTLQGNLSKRIWKLHKSHKPEPRSLMAAVARTGKTIERLFKANKDSAKFAQFRLESAAIIADHLGRKITRGEMERLSGCSPHTVNKYSWIWKEKLQDTLKLAWGLTEKHLNNLIRWLARYVSRMRCGVVQAVIKVLAPTGEQPTGGAKTGVNDSVNPGSSFFASLFSRSRQNQHRVRQEKENLTAKARSGGAANKKAEAAAQAVTRIITRPINEVTAMPEPEFESKLDTTVLPFDQWVKDNMLALREHVSRVQQKNPNMRIRGIEIISTLYRRCGGKPIYTMNTD